jgi:hypothetical protein
MKNALGSNQYRDRYKAHYWGSIALLAIGYLVIQIGIFGVEEGNSRLKIAFASENVVTTTNLINKRTNEENQALKEKLGGMFSVTTSDTTKKIVEYYLTKYFGKDADIARKVFTCESGLRPEAVHTNKAGFGQDAGVSQLNSKYQGKRFEKMNPGISFDIGAHDIEMNLKVAKAIFDEQGWNPWMCSKIIGVVK